MIIQSRAQRATAALPATLARLALLTLLTTATGCLRHSAVSQDLGLQGEGVTQRALQGLSSASAENSRQAGEWSDELLRAMFQKQTVGAFDPLTDDRRVQLLQGRLKLNPRDVAIRMELAGVYENYRLCSDGFEQYAEVLRLAPSAAADWAVGEQAVAGLGRCARAARRGGEAIPLMEAFLKQRPSAGSFNELGLLYDAVGDLVDGESALREAVARDAESDQLRNNLGYNLLLQNKAEAAEAEFRRALDLNPKGAITRNNLGVALVRRGDPRGALEQFQMTSDAATAHNNVAVVLLEMGQYEQGRGELVKALAIRRNFAPALANFKLVQARIRERAELPKAGSVPVTPVPSALVALKETASPAPSDLSPNQLEGQQKGAESLEPDERLRMQAR